MNSPAPFCLRKSFYPLSFISLEWKIIFEYPRKLQNAINHEMQMISNIVKITSIGFIIHFHIFFLIFEGVLFPSLFILFEWMEMFLKLKTKNFPKVNQMKFKSAPHHFPLYFIYFKEVLLSSLMKILEWHKVPDLKYSQMEFKLFSNPFLFLQMEEVILSSL